MGKKTIPQRRQIIIAGMILVFLFAGGWELYNYVSLNLWISSDHRNLEGYPTHLIRDRRPVTGRVNPDDEITRVEDVLILDVSRDRIVINLSRSDVRFSPFRRKAWVKVYLETAVPDNTDDKRIRVKLLEELRRSDGEWHLESTTNLIIQ